MSISTELYNKAKTLIPGGTQLLSKRPEMFLPEQWPSYYSKSKGCEVWDLDGNHYYDMSYMGIGANILGYSDDDVNRAVIDAVNRGSMNTLNCPEEVELAELLCDLHPWASMVRFSKTGGEAMAVAVRIARAHTRRDIILFCGYHGWADWYLAANLSEDNALDGHLLKGLDPAGVPRNLMNSIYPFAYNDTNAFKALIQEHGDRIAAVVMEPIRNDMPDPDFIETIQSEAKRHSIILITDEITAGWRLCCGGAHLSLGIEPDIAVFAKAISNGFPMSAIIGKKSVMNDAQNSFISSTYWTERTGLAASIATIKKLKENDVSSYLINMGKYVQKRWAGIGEETGLNIHVGGIYPLSHFTFLYKNKMELKTFFTQSMLDKGFLAIPSLYLSFSHTKEHIDSYLDAVKSTFKVLKKHIDKGDVRDQLRGPVCHSGFQRLT